MIIDPSDRGKVDESQLEKTVVSGRVPKYVKKYADDHNLSISQLLMAGFDAYREQDIVHASERLSYHENRCLHWRGICLQNTEESKQKTDFVNIIRTEFKQQGRGHPHDKNQDKTWLQARVKTAQKHGILLTVDELYEFCVKSDKNNGGSKK